MLAIVTSDQRLTEADADLTKETVQEELKAGGFGANLKVMVFGHGVDVTLINEKEEVIFSTIKGE